jgi:hypothetical protein
MLNIHAPPFAAQDRFICPVSAVAIRSLGAGHGAAGVHVPMGDEAGPAPLAFTAETSYMKLLLAAKPLSV